MTPSAAPRWWAREDWLAVWLGGVILLLILAGVRPVVPALRWSDAASLTGLLSPGALVPWAAVGFAAWLLSLPGIALLDGDVRRYSVGFPVVFVLAWLAQLWPVNGRRWGIEYVIFALILGLLVRHVWGTPADS